MKIPVLTAAAGARWESELVAALVTGSHPIVISRRCVDVVDLMAVAATGQGRVALVAAGLRDFDVDAVDRLRASGVVPVAVVDRGGGGALRTIHARGVRFTVPHDADVAVIASVIRSAVDEGEAGSRSGGLARAFADPVRRAVDHGDASRSELAARRPGRQSSPGRLIAVWGPTGAPGRTTVATGIADEIARAGTASLLVDADVYGGTVATVLGLIDESPGLAAACRATSGTGLDTATLAALCWQVRPTLRVLTGIPLAQRWPEIRPVALCEVLMVARSLARCVIVDCGFALEADEELSYDSQAPRRNGATLTVLDAADGVVVVGSADPIGLQRLVRGLGELRDAGIEAPVHIVVNRARPGLLPRDGTAELTSVLTRLAGRAPDSVLPEDRDAMDAALVSGRLLGEVRPSSPLRRAMGTLAARVSGVEVPAARHRRRG